MRFVVPLYVGCRYKEGYTQDGRRLPRFPPSGRGDMFFFQHALDAIGRLPFEEQSVDAPHHLRFFRHDLWLAVLALAIAEEVLVLSLSELAGQCLSVPGGSCGERRERKQPREHPDAEDGDHRHYGFPDYVSVSVYIALFRVRTSGRLGEGVAKCAGLRALATAIQWI